MKSIAIRACGLAAAVGLGLLPMAGGAHAAQAHQQTTRITKPTVATVWSSATGIPRTVKRGSTITITMWYRQTSPDVMLPGDFSLELWNLWTRGSLRHAATASWLDPASHRWTSGTVGTGTDTVYFDLQPHVILSPSDPLRVLSGQWAHVQVRLTFSKTATRGQWTIMTAPVVVPSWFRGASFDDPVVNYVNPVNHGAFPVYTFKVV